MLLQFRLLSFLLQQLFSLLLLMSQQSTIFAGGKNIFVATLSSLSCTWEILKDNIHLCPECGLNLSETAKIRRREEGKAATYIVREKGGGNVESCKDKDAVPRPEECSSKSSDIIM